MRNVRVFPMKTPITQERAIRSRRWPTPDAGRTALRGSFMSIKASWGLTVLLAASALVGCGQSRQLVRGQSPSNCPPQAESQGPIIGSGPGYAEGTKPHMSKHGHDFQAYRGFRDNNFGYEGGYYAGPQGYYTDRDRTYRAGAGAGAGAATGCPACEYGRGCPQGGCQHCGCNSWCNSGNCGPGGCPQHYQTYQYNWPQNMVSPPTDVPNAMVQYPYYTLRGPTDFFMK